MRAQAELAATTERLAEAARRGPDPDAVHARLGALKLLVGDIVADVENGLPALADGGPGLAGRAARHLVGAGGKRVRPLLVILAARASGVAADCLETRASLTQLAQAAELVHAATLLHDDVLDDGRTRREVWAHARPTEGGRQLVQMHQLKIKI